MRRLLLTLTALLLALAITAPVGAQPPATGDPRPAFGDLDAPLRPGAPIGWCTFNYVFYDSVLEEGQDPVAYIGTAGHCTDEIGEIVPLEGYGPVGRVVYDSDLVGSNVDFSLIELRPEVIAHTNPAVLGWDGPYGSIGAEELSLGDVVDLHGYGMVLGENPYTRDRQGLLVGWTDDEYVVNMPAVYGDSGAPLIHDATGMALGIISRFGFFEAPPSTDRGPLMSYIFDELEAAGFGDVVLATVEQ